MSGFNEGWIFVQLLLGHAMDVSAKAPSVHRIASYLLAKRFCRFHIRSDPSYGLLANRDKHRFATTWTPLIGWIRHFCFESQYRTRCKVYH